MRLLLILLVLPFVVSCNSLHEKEKALRMMREKVTVIPYDKMTCWLNDSVVEDTIGPQAKYKLVVYVDSLVCSTCYLNEMYQWQDFVDMELKSYFSIIFIFAPPSKNKYTIQNHFYRTELNHPIYVDTSYCFLRENPHLTERIMFHTFLLDENDKVILVGNPLHNKNIEDMLRKILKKGLE